MGLILDEEDSFCFFDRGDNDNERLFWLNVIGSDIIVKGKKNNDLNSKKCARSFSPGSGIQSNDVGNTNCELTRRKPPEKTKRITF